MKTVIDNKIRVQDPNAAILQWTKDNLVMPNPDYIKKVRMGFYLGHTQKKLNLFEYYETKNTLALPFGTLREVQDILLAGGEIETRFEKPAEVDYGDPVPLYGYQKEAVEDCYKKRYGILQSPAGSGKTQMGLALIQKYGRRALWLTHTIDLVRQSKARAEQYMDKSLLGTIIEGKVDVGKGITFATVQTMANVDLDELKNMWDVIVVDECHRVAGTYTNMTRFYRVLSGLAARHKYGITATAYRADGMIKATFALIGGVIHTVPDEAVSDTVMNVAIRPVAVDTPPSTQYLGTDGMLNYTKLIGYLCENEERNKLIASCIVAEKDHPCLILSDRLEHLRTLMEMLPPDMREQAVMVSGDMTSKAEKQERTDAMEDMRKGRKKYLFASYSLAKEGLDIPCLERLFLTVPRKDKGCIVQSIGRIARVDVNKKFPVAYDFVDENIKYCHNSYRERYRYYVRMKCGFVHDD